MSGHLKLQQSIDIKRKVAAEYVTPSKTFVAIFVVAFRAGFIVYILVYLYVYNFFCGEGGALKCKANASCYLVI